MFLGEVVCYLCSSGISWVSNSLSSPSPSLIFSPFSSTLFVTAEVQIVQHVVSMEH